MIPESFAEHFHILADAPNGVKKLREMIIQLAVQGKLTRQDPNNEPASVLLKKIKAEKEKLIKGGKINKQKPLPPINPNDMPHELSKGWEWVRLGKISAKIHYGYTASAIPIVRDVRFLRITDIQDDHVKWDEVPGCQIDEAKVKDYELSGGDILIARTGGTIGKSYLVTDLSVRAVFASYLIRIILASNTFSQYIKLFLGSELYWTQLYDKSMGTGQPNVNATALKSLCVPLPPLAEQKRIVAKVDQLTALCGELEAGQKKRAKKRITLNNTCLNALTSADKDSTQNAWKRISDNFDLFYECPENVSELRQSILQLAVQGKLIRQDPNDEPASVLLKKIKVEKEKLIKEGKIKKQKPLPPINPDEVPNELPVSWAWVRLGNVTNYGMADKVEPGYINDGTWVLELEDIEKTTSRLLVRVRYPEKQFKSTKNVFMEGDVLYGKLRPYLDKVLVADEPGVCTTEMIPIQGCGGINPFFLRIALKAPDFIAYANASTHGMNLPRLGTEKARLFTFALPPIAEQKRVVTKLDQLMALCDELEARLKQTQSATETLMEAVVNELTVA